MVQKYAITKLFHHISLKRGFFHRFLTSSCSYWCSLMCVALKRPEADEWGPDSCCEVIPPLPDKDSSHRKQAETHFFYPFKWVQHSHTQHDPPASPGVSKAARYSVSCQQRWRFSVIHLLHVKLGSQTRLSRRPLVTPGLRFEKPEWQVEAAEQGWVICICGYANPHVPMTWIRSVLSPG